MILLVVRCICASHGLVCAVIICCMWCGTWWLARLTREQDEAFTVSCDSARKAAIAWYKLCKNGDDRSNFEESFSKQAKRLQFFRRYLGTVDESATTSWNARNLQLGLASTCDATIFPPSLCSLRPVKSEYIAQSVSLRAV